MCGAFLLTRTSHFSDTRIVSYFFLLCSSVPTNLGGSDAYLPSGRRRAKRSVAWRKSNPTPGWRTRSTPRFEDATLENSQMLLQNDNSLVLTLGRRGVYNDFFLLRVHPAAAYNASHDESKSKEGKQICAAFRSNLAMVRCTLYTRDAMSPLDANASARASVSTQTTTLAEQPLYSGHVSRSQTLATLCFLPFSPSAPSIAEFLSVPAWLSTSFDSPHINSQFQFANVCGVMQASSWLRGHDRFARGMLNRMGGEARPCWRNGVHQPHHEGKMSSSEGSSARFDRVVDYCMSQTAVSSSHGKSFS